MRLFIAEKPSLGRAIADALPGRKSRHQGYITTDQGDVVSWCIGHLLEQAEPDAYDARFKSWKMEHLPIIPEQWQLKPKYKTRSQLAVLRQLVKEASQIVHCGDPDREGQLLVDEVIGYLKVNSSLKQNAQRCLINDLNLPAVKRALENLQPNSHFIPLSVSALARSRADWLYGMNMTRAYTLQGQKAGYRGVLSVGRVQTPLLGLVVNRDQEIERFVPRDYHEVLATAVPTEKATDKENTGADSLPLKLKWQPSEACRPYQDEEGRVLHRALAENVQSRILNQDVHITAVKQKQKKQPPPLPFNLSTLQIEASRAYGMNAQTVLDVCQSLYETHQLITYPRSDCRYLPEGQHRDAAEVIGAIRNSCNELLSGCDDAEPSLKSRTWNDSKTEAHHAIIPTAKSLDTQRLNKREQQIYRHIARQYLMQFYPSYEYAETRVEANIEGGLFTANATQLLKPGWKALQKSLKKQSNADDDKQSLLPPVKEGEVWFCSAADILDKQTRPPEYFTDATILAAMTGIARFVKDADIRKTLKETDGLGTEATRAGIIELLFKRGFLERQGKQIRATDLGKALVRSLPDSSVTPDMTARWEQQLNAISERRINYDGFIQPMTDNLKRLIGEADQCIYPDLKNLPQPAAKKRAYRRKKKAVA